MSNQANQRIKNVREQMFGYVDYRNCLKVMKSNVLAVPDSAPGSLLPSGNIQPAKAEITKIMTAEEILTSQHFSCNVCTRLDIIDGKDLHSLKQDQEMADSWWKKHKNLTSFVFIKRQGS